MISASLSPSPLVALHLYLHLPSLRMRSAAVRCYSQSTFLCPGSRLASKVAPSSRAPSGPVGTTTWRHQSLFKERRKTAQRCVLVCFLRMYLRNFIRMRIRIYCTVVKFKNSKVRAYVKSIVPAFPLPARFLSRVCRTSTERCTKTWLLCSCCLRMSGWRPLQWCCRTRAKQRMITLRKKRRTRL